MIAILSSLLFFLLPIFLGRPFMRFFYRKELTYPFISYFMVGSILLYLALFAGFALKQFVPLFGGFSLIQEIIFILSFILLPLNLIVSQDDIDVRSYVLPVGISAALAGVAFGIWQLHSPYSLNWDLYEHQTLTNNILGGKINILPSSLTDTFGFNGYSTLFHSLIAASQAFFNMSILSYWTTISFFQLMLAIFASYLFTKEVTNSKFIAFIASLITAFAFDSSISYTTLFFIPQAFTALIFVFLCTQLISEAKSGRVMNTVLVAFSSLFLFINHYIVGSLAAFSYLASYFYIRFSQVIEKRVRTQHLLMTGLFICLIGIIFSSSIPLGFINSGEAQDYALNLMDKFNIMRQSYGYLLLLLLPLGIFSVISSKKRVEILALSILVFILSIVLMQLPYTVKFYTLGRFFVDAFLAIGAYALLKRMNVFFKVLSVGVLTTTLLGIFITNTIAWKGILRYQDSYVQISDDEVHAAEFLRTTYPSSDVFLVSDPATQNILEPISGVNSQGGAYTSKETRKILSELNRAKDTKEIMKDLYRIKDKIGSTKGKRLLILSGRYFQWQKSLETQKMAFSYNVWNPSSLTLRDIGYIDSLLTDSSHFRLLYLNKDVAIIEATQ